MKTLGILVMMIPFLGTNGYPAGAVNNATVCQQMVPLGHLSVAPNPQAFPSPYKITASSTSYSPNQQLTVTLSGLCGNKFRGFLIEARSADPAVTDIAGHGTFANMGSDSQPMCTNNHGITHTSNSDKDAVQVRWTAPSTGAGHIVFVATVVQTFNTYYVKQKSPVIQDSSLTGPTPPTYDGVPTATLNNNACPTAVPPPAPGARLTKPSGCGNTQGCFTDCDSTGCSFVVSWIPHDDHAMFMIRANFPSTSDQGYMALGFSDDQRMGDDGVTECVFQNTMNVYNSKNTGRQNKRFSQTAATLNSGSYADGVFTCEFELPNSGTPDDPLFSMKRSRYLLLARGTSFTTSNLVQHTELPRISSEMANLESTKDVSGSSPSLTLVKVHGSLMVLAWIFAASIGVVVARHYKSQWQDQTCIGEKIWFQLHRGFMVLVFVAAASAFIIIFVEVKGWSDLGGQASKKAHPILGVIVTALCVINPIMAIFRPHPGDANRPLFNWAHFSVGSAAHILAVITIFLGVNLGKPAIPQYVTWILVGYVCWQLLVELILVCFRCQSDQKDRSETYEMMQRGQHVDSQQERSKSSPVRQGILILHIIIITSFAVAVINLIARAK